MDMSETGQCILEYQFPNFEREPPEEDGLQLILNLQLLLLPLHLPFSPPYW